jgi:hypothetical protein
MSKGEVLMNEFSETFMGKDGAGEDGFTGVAGPPYPRPFTCPPIVQLHPSVDSKLVRSGAWKQGANAGRIVEFEVEGAVRLFGGEHCGMLTIGCPGNDRLGEMREFSARFDSFNSNLLAGRFVQWMAVIQRHKDGVIHAHIPVVTSWEMGGPPYWDKHWRRHRSRATARCREEWEVFTPDRMSGFGLGVANLKPMQGDPRAFGRYVGRYVGRELGTRRKEDRGVRLVRYSHSWHRVVCGPFSAADHRTRQAWDRAQKLGKRLWGSIERMVNDLGPQWKWHLRRVLYSSAVFEGVVSATEHDLEYFDGPTFALDAQIAAMDERARFPQECCPWEPAQVP